MIKFFLLFCSIVGFTAHAQSMEKSTNKNNSYLLVQVGGNWHTFQNPVSQQSSLYNFYRQTKFGISYGLEAGYQVNQTWQFGVFSNYFGATQSVENISAEPNSPSGSVVNNWRYIAYGINAYYGLPLSNKAQLGPSVGLGALNFSNKINYFDDAYSVNANDFLATVGVKANFILDEIVLVFVKSEYQFSTLKQPNVQGQSPQQSTHPAIITNLNAIRVQVGVQVNFLRQRQSPPSTI